MIRPALLLAPAAALLLSGCLAKTAFDVATLPVRVASHAVDMATTSQAEADQKRGREMRRREAQLGKLQRQHDALARKCAGGDQASCTKAEGVAEDIADLMPAVPLESRR